MNDKLPTEDRFARYREPSFQQQLAEFLDRGGIIESLERVYRDNIEGRPMRAVIAAIKKEAGV